MLHKQTEIADNPEAEEANPLAVGKLLILSILKYLNFSIFNAKFFSLFNFSIN